MFGTRDRLGPAFGYGNSFTANIANSNYHSLQITAERKAADVTFLAAYTFAKAIDNSSGFGEWVNFSNYRLSRSLSAYDVTHNFVLSYSWALPFGKGLPTVPRMLLDGWNLAGITRFSTGFPISIRQGQDQSLVGSGNTDVPNRVGPVQIQDPHNPGPNGANTYFLPDAFESGRLGEFGTSNRRFFHGPGIVNWDFAVMKDTRITEKTLLQFRAEFFNILNHTAVPQSERELQQRHIWRGDQRSRPADRPNEPQVYLLVEMGLHWTFLQVGLVVLGCAVPAVSASQAESFRQSGLECAKKKNWNCAVENYRSAVRLEPDADSYYNLALALKYMGKLEEASTEFEAALRLHPNWADAQYGLGACLYELRKTRPGLDALRAAVKTNPGLINARLYLASALTSERNWSEAELQFTAVLQMQPNLLRARRALASVYLAAGSPEQAATELRTCVRAAPRDAGLWLELGVAEGRAANLNAAIAALRRSIELDPGISAAHLQLGTALRRSGHEDAALEQFREAAKLAPMDPAAAFELGKSLKAAGDLAGASASLRRAVELKPDFEPARYALGLTLTAQGDKASGRTELKQVADLHRFREQLAESKLLISTGVEMLKKNELDPAQEQFERAVELSPSLATGFYYLGVVYGRKDMPDRALSAYRKALELAPDYAQAHVGLGSWYARHGDMELARKEFELAVVNDPDLAEAHYNLGLVLLRAGNTEGAVREFSETLSIDPSFSDARIQVGLMQAQAGDLGSAERTFRELIRREPANAEAYNNLGTILLQSKEMPGAIAAFRKSIELKPGYAAGQIQSRAGASRLRAGAGGEPGVRGGDPDGPQPTGEPLRG